MGYAPIKTDRGVIGWLLLSIVTCGIYSYYFLYCLARDINVMCQDDGDPRRVWQHLSCCRS